MKLLNKYKNTMIKGSILLFLVLLIMFPKASFEGASSGLLLWFHNVLPNLLPFIIVSNLLIRLNISKQICRLFYPILGRLFHVSRDGCYPIIIGFLSGIPMGAKSAADMVSEKKITTGEGQFLLALTNNASPMFIMGYIAITQLKLPNIKYVLFAIIYAASILGALIHRFFITNMGKRSFALSSNAANPLSAQEISKSPRFSFEILDSTIMNGFDVVTKIGGYIILFSILAQIIHVIGPQVSYGKAFIMGIIEITTGINQVCKIDMSDSIKIVLVTVLTSFGGLSGMAQTKSVLGGTRLSIVSYFFVKMLNALIALLLSVLYVTLFPVN